MSMIRRLVATSSQVFCFSPFLPRRAREAAAPMVRLARPQPLCSIASIATQGVSALGHVRRSQFPCHRLASSDGVTRTISCRHYCSSRGRAPLLLASVVLECARNGSEAVGVSQTAAHLPARRYRQTALMNRGLSHASDLISGLAGFLRDRLRFFRARLAPNR